MPFQWLKNKQTNKAGVRLIILIFIPKESEQKKQKAEYRRNEVLPLVEIQFSCSSFTPQDQPANPKTPAASTMCARSQVDKVCRLEDAQGYEFVHVWKPEKGTEECAAEMQPFTSLPVYQPTQTPPAASTMSARSQVDKVCRLEDAQGYEFVPMWKSEKGTEECAAEMQPFTSLPVYQPTQRPLRHRRWGLPLRETRCVAWRMHRVMSLHPCENQKKEQRSVGLRCSPLLRSLVIWLWVSRSLTPARKVSRSVKDLCGWRIRDTLHGGRRSP